jgi:competence protein ComEC
VVRLCCSRGSRAVLQPVPSVRFSEWIAAAVLLAFALLLATYPFAPLLVRGDFEATVLDVGQGDSSFAAFPEGRTMPVDGGGLAGSEWFNGSRSGPDIEEEVVSEYLWSRNQAARCRGSRARAS